MKREILSKIRTILQSGWCAETAYRKLEYTGQPLSMLQCYVTARAVAEVFGWQIIHNKRQGNNHYWNRASDGSEVDFTSDQAGGNGFDPILKGTVSKRKFQQINQSANPRLRLYFQHVESPLRKLKEELNL